MRTLTKFSITTIAAVCALCAAFLYFAFGNHIESAENCPQVEWLPSSASNISYYINNNIGYNRAYEFTISPSEFQKLAAERNWKMEKLTGSEHILRYTFYTKSSNRIHATASKGLYMNNRHSNGGGITVLYDEENTIAYLTQSTR